MAIIDASVERLLSHPRVQKELAEHPDRVRRGDEEALDLLTDLVLNEGAVAEALTGDGDSGEFPIRVMKFGALYWVEAQQFDASDFFDSLEDACLFAYEEYGAYFLSNVASVTLLNDAAGLRRLLNEILDFELVVAKPCGSLASSRFRSVTS